MRFFLGLEDSLSGSASSSSEDESSGEGASDAVNALVNKTKRLNARLVSASDEQEETQKKLPHSPLIWFHSSQHQTQLGVYRTVFPTYIESRGYLDEVKEMQKGGPEGRTWAMFMVAGGHFAGAIIKVAKSDEDREEELEDGVMGTTGKKKKPKKPKPETEVLRHKTFHRYTSEFIFQPLVALQSVDLKCIQRVESRVVRNLLMTMLRDPRRVPVPSCVVTASKHCGTCV